jgi:hypothetical protein
MQVMAARVRDLAAELLVPPVCRVLAVVDDALWDGGEDADAMLPTRPDALAPARQLVESDAEAGTAPVGV